jgi:hypothetical protein
MAFHGTNGHASRWSIAFGSDLARVAIEVGGMEHLVSSADEAVGRPQKLPGNQNIPAELYQEALKTAECQRAEAPWQGAVTVTR